MNSRSLKIYPVVLLILLTVTCIARGEEIKPLDRDTATKILGAMGYSKVTVGAIVGGGALDPGASRRVLGVGIQSGKEAKIETTFSYDNDLGWIYFEFKMTGARGQAIDPNMPPGFGGGDAAKIMLRIWSTAGYKEIVVGK
ncbi:MAG TPA: hypothetical protein VIL86_19575 [Tepidisphaeraceae bacterium]|jgi:hypothetical protein